ncbi:fungal-specific transcription factor domain-containing protein [Leptodontidium sp. 2 PMI_412]|nr:fungal-specific transcription factor domain-containing protein [Leptodontidium sp. 2 PMI_412]
MNVFLGIAVLRIGQNNENFTIEATKFYNPSVNAVSRSIREGKINGTEEWLLVLIAFMVIFETSRFELCGNVMLHLGGLAQLFHIRKLKHALPDQRRPFHRIAAEAFAYHLATYSILYSSHDIDGVAQQFTWSDLQGYDKVMPYPEASKLANSPILGLQFDLFKTIFEITRLSRHTPLTTSDFAMAVEFKKQLDLIQQRVTQGLDFEDEGDEHESQEIALLYILVTQIFLFKVMNPDSGIEHPTITHVLSQALLFVDKCRVYAACNSFFCWPLTILACAIRIEEEKELIQRKMAECRQWTHSGQIHRSSSIINAIWEDESPERLSGVSDTTNSPRGLDRLLHKEGLVDALFPSRCSDSG